MAAVFGAPTIGDAEGQTPANAFGNSFFPHQENTTNDLAFENDANDPFTLHATDTDGNEFTYRSGAAYDSDGIDTADAMVLTDANGQTWFAEDGSALNTEGLGDGVTVGSDGSVVDANGNIVSDNVANALGSTDVADVSEASIVGAAVEGDTADIEMASAPAIASDGGTVEIDSVVGGGADASIVGAAVEGDTADIDTASAPAIASDGGTVMLVLLMCSTSVGNAGAVDVDVQIPLSAITMLISPVPRAQI